MLNASVLKFVSGRIDITDEVPTHFVGGVPFNVSGQLCVSPSTELQTVDHFHNGMAYDAQGRLMAVDGSPGHFAQGGLPYLGNRMCGVADGIVNHHHAGIPFDIDAKLVVNAPLPPFTPNELPGITAWWRKGDVIAPGSIVSLWNDTEGLYPLQVPAGSQGPTFATGIVTFNGVNQMLATTDTLELLGPVTYYIRCKFVTWIAGMQFMGNVLNNRQVIAQENVPPPPQRLLISGPIILDQTIPIDTPLSIVAVYDGANSFFEVSGIGSVSGDDNNPGIFPGNGVSVGGTPQFSQYSNIAVAEGAVYLAAHNEAERDAMLGYLNGIVV